MTKAKATSGQKHENFSLKGWVSAGLFAYFLFVPAGFALAGRIEAATLLAGIGAGAILLTRLQDIESFSFLSLKTQLREAANRAENAAKEVEISAASLRDLAVSLAEASIRNLLMSTGFGKSWTYGTKFTHFEKIINSLENLGCSDEQIDQVRSLWLRHMKNLALGALEQAIATATSEDESVSWKAYKEANAPNEMTSEKIREFLKEAKVFDTTLQERVSDYENFLKTGLLKNPDVIPSNWLI